MTVGRLLLWRHGRTAANAGFPGRLFNSSRAITTFCTSVAPS